MHYNSQIKEKWSPHSLADSKNIEYCILRHEIASGSAHSLIQTAATHCCEVRKINFAVNTDPLDYGSALAEPCVGEGGCDQWSPLQPLPCPVLKMPSRRAGGQWAGKEGSEECPAVTHSDDSHHLGVLIPPTKRERKRERDWDTRRDKKRGRQTQRERQMDRDRRVKGDKEGVRRRKRIRGKERETWKAWQKPMIRHNPVLELQFWKLQYCV